MSDRDYWIRQGDKPAFPDIDWQKPQNKKAAGRLLIVGGNAHGFELPAKAFQYSEGAGEVKILLPSAIEKLLPSGGFPVVYASSTEVGSFAKPEPESIDKYLEWADHILLAGDFGHNSQTALFYEYLIDSAKPITLTKDSLYYTNKYSKQTIEREHITLVASFSQLQELLKSISYPKAISSKMGLLELIEILKDLTDMYESAVIVKWQESIVVAKSGLVSTTKDIERDLWQLSVASRAAILMMQNPNQSFEALTHAVFESVNIQ